MAIKHRLAKSSALYNFVAVAVKRSEWSRRLLIRFGIIAREHSYKESLETLDIATFVPSSADELLRLKAMLPQLREEAVRAMVAGYEAADRKYLPLFKQKLEVVPFPQSERKRLIAASETVWREWAAERDAQGMPGTEILEFANAQVAKFGNR
ncbi:MAG: hypothetical protein IIA41_15580 [SAR324 cluster bacterium]|nr:hypothetical protein [SAR324 cluster bacterium]